MKDKNSEFLNFIDYGLELAKSIPKYFSKFSNKIFSNHQKIVLLVLKQKLKTTFRGLIEWLKATSEARLYLGLKRIPHHTTLIKFAEKLNARLLNFLFRVKKAKNVAIDYSGFELDSKSYYYRNINKHLFKNFIRKTKKFMRLAITADTDKQNILKYNISKRHGNNNKEFRAMLRDLKVDYVLADKGYDSRENRKFVFNLNAIPQIPFKKTSGRDGYYQRKADKLFDNKIYHQRSKVETIFSVIKRRYGSCIKARSYAAQKIELICKLIAYNIDRKLKLLALLIRGFQQS